jgi:hypothetical protein
MPDQPGFVPASATSAPPAQEHPSTERRPGELKAECRLATDTNIYSPAAACNVTTEGVHLISMRRFGGGAVLTVRLFAPASEAVVIKRARVRYVGPGSENGWLHSCAFMKSLHKEELRMLLDTAPDRDDGDSLATTPG